MELNSCSVDYEKLFSHVKQLQPIALMATGRSGSDYLQSLLEGHPEVLTFNGHFAWYEAFYNIAQTVSVDTQNTRDVVSEFIGIFIHKLVTRYDLQEKKNQLGRKFNETLEVDLDEFKFHTLRLIENQELNSRNWLLAVYGAYSMCLNRDLLKTKIFLHHPHLESELRQFVSEFPNSKVVFTVRDIRASLLSQIENFRRYYPKTHDSEAHLYESLQMNLKSIRIVQDLNLETLSIRLEDLPREDVLRGTCAWLGIDWNPIVLSSTWGGLEWNGDALSTKVPQKSWSEDRTYNDWRNRLSKRDQLLLRACAGKKLVLFGYENRQISLFARILLIFVALLPLSLEMRYLSPQYILKCFRLKKIGIVQLLEAPWFYFKRVQMCILYLCRSFSGEKEQLTWIRRS